LELIGKLPSVSTNCTNFICFERAKFLLLNAYTPQVLRLKPQMKIPMFPGERRAFGWRETSLAYQLHSALLQNRNIFPSPFSVIKCKKEFPCSTNIPDEEEVHSFEASLACSLTIAMKDKRKIFFITRLICRNEMMQNLRCVRRN
jgi:hypothetical protein